MPVAAESWKFVQDFRHSSLGEVEFPHHLFVPAEAEGLTAQAI